MPISLNADTNIANLTKTIQVPQDSVDNVDQTSVNQPYQKLLNNFYSTLNRMPYVKPSLSMSCLDGATITVYPFDGLWASKSALLANLDYTCLSKTTSTNITAADIVGGGGYVANTIYYVYAIYDSPSGNSTKLIIRTDAPDATKTWAVVAAITQYNHRYIGSLICDVGPIIKAFNMKDGQYRLLDTGTVTGSPLTGIADVNVTCNLLPVTASQITFLMGFTNTSGGSATFSLKPTGAAAYKYSLTVAITSYSSIHEINLPLIGTPYNGFTGVWSGGLCSAFFQYSGYKE